MVEIYNSQFNKPVDGFPTAPKQRDTDFLKLDSLHLVAEQHGLVAFRFSKLDTGWAVDYFKANRATEPKREFSRDAQDYELKLEIWMKQCTVQSKPYATFEDMVLGEIERLKNRIE